jgi:hypothetical protein
MFDLYLSPIRGQEHFTLEELGQIRMIKNKAHIIYYTKNISLNEATKIVLNKYYTLNPLNTFEYIFINFQKKVEFQYLIDDNNNNTDDSDDTFDVNDIYENNINNETVKELKKHNENIGSILNIKKKKKHNKNVIFNIEQNVIIEFDNGK